MNRSTGHETSTERVIPRRDVLKGTAILSSGVAAALWGVGVGLAGPVHGVPEWFQARLQDGTPAATPEAVETYVPTALTAAEAATLRAVCNRLIPPDELGIGAGDAGAFVYIDWTLAGPGAAMLPLYQSGLAALEAEAGGIGFASLDSATQDQILKKAEAGELDDAAEEFFAVVLEYTRQGMFGDPMYGGNAGFSGWDLIQYPGIKLSWTAEEQAIGTVVEPAHRSVADQGGIPYTKTDVVRIATPVAVGGGTPK